MRLPPIARVQRTGFTLIELLVVIAIIAILVGLTAAGVMKVMFKGPELQNRNDITQLASAIESFKGKFQVEYIPSRIKLCRTLNQYDPNQQLDKDSIAYLKKLFPRCEATWGSSGIDWGPPGWGNVVTLEGQECLVFFLGGKQVTGPNGVMGFSSNPLSPMPPPGVNGDITPFAEFKSDRLVPGTNGGFFVYLDAHKSLPYAYFSSYKSRNNYNRYGSSDCPTLGVSPYREAAGQNRYYNPSGFQIISAGTNKLFGPGDAPLPAPRPGDDDLANFHPRRLGAE